MPPTPPISLDDIDLSTIDLTKLRPGQKRELLGLLEEKEKRRLRNKWLMFYPDEGPLRRELYAAHMQFFAAGLDHQERAILGANRSGKSTAAAYEMACHLTGIYPHWWKGRRFDRPTMCWAAGDDAKTVRETIQVTLMGLPGQWGTGMIPGSHVAGHTMRAGTPEAMDTLSIKHVAGGLSRLVFKGYDQGREAFQGAKVDAIWLDEEPPMSVYSEALTRTMSTVPGEQNGTIFCTFTPLRGISDVVLMFLPGGREPEHGGARFVVVVPWGDHSTPHLDEKARAQMIAAIPPHMRDARTKGIPQLGAGAIYPVAEETLLTDPFEFPAWYRHVYGLDVGWNRTAAVWGAVDPETDILYLYSEHYVGNEQPPMHASAIKARGAWIPGVIDPAARGRGQDDGKKLFDQYAELGLMLTPAKNALEAGIYEVWTRASSGRLKIFKGLLPNLLAEWRLYRRNDKGHPADGQADHLMDALRYLCMSGITLAQQRPANQWAGRPGMPPIRMRGPAMQQEYKPFSDSFDVSKLK